MLGFIAKHSRRSAFAPGRAVRAFGSAVALSMAASAYAQVAGTWVLSSTIPVSSSEVATDVAKVDLQQNGPLLSGVYAGLLDIGRPVQGSFDGTQIALTVTGVWPTDGSAIVAALSGPVSAAKGSGSLVAGPAQGSWTARRPNPGENLEPSARVDYRSQAPGAVHRVRVPLAAHGRAGGEYIDFLTGFVTPDGEVWGRPVGVTIGGDGAVLVSDDGSKSVWRVAPLRRRHGAHDESDDKSDDHGAAQ